MNALSNESAATIVPLLSEAVGEIEVRKSFGITRLLVSHKPFAIIKSGRLFFRVDDQNRADFDKAERKNPEEMLIPPGHASELVYRQVPSHIMHDQPKLDAWARTAAEVSARVTGFIL